MIVVEFRTEKWRYINTPNKLAFQIQKNEKYLERERERVPIPIQ